MSELIHHFGIDWKLLLAQAANFLILLWVLKRFAYGPIRKILQKRREEIEKGIKFSEEAKRKVEEVEALKNETLNTARTEALSIVTEGEETAKKRKEEILKDTARKAEIMIGDAKRVIEEEKAKMGENVYKSAEELVRLGVEKVLGKMPQDERNQLLIQEALRELRLEVK